MEKEKRQRTRVSLDFKASIEHEGEIIPIQIVDLSLRGLQCLSDPRLIQGQKCKTTIDLSPETSIHFNSEVSWVEPQKTGIFFISMESDSFVHLKKLVQYNADNPETIEHEIATPFKKHP